MVSADIAASVLLAPCVAQTLHIVAQREVGYVGTLVRHERCEVRTYALTLVVHRGVVRNGVQVERPQRAVHAHLLQLNVGFVYCRHQLYAEVLHAYSLRRLGELSVVLHVCVEVAVEQELLIARRLHQSRYRLVFGSSCLAHRRLAELISHLLAPFSETLYHVRSVVGSYTLQAAEQRNLVGYLSAEIVHSAVACKLQSRSFKCVGYGWRHASWQVGKRHTLYCCTEQLKQSLGVCSAAARRCIVAEIAIRSTAQSGLCLRIDYSVSATCWWWVRTFSVVLHESYDRTYPSILCIVAAGPLKLGAHIAKALLCSTLGALHHLALHVACEVVAVEVLLVHHEHRYHIALLRCEREARVFYHRHEHETVCRWRCILHVLCGNESAVAQHYVEECALAAVDVGKNNCVGSIHLHYRHRHLRLVRQLGGDVVLVFYLCLLHSPVYSDCLVADSGKMLGCFARTHQHVLVVSVVAVCRNVQMVVAFVQIVERDAAVRARHILHHECAGVVVGESHAGVAHVRMLAVLVAVYGVLVANADAKVALLLAHHLHVEANQLAVALAAVDGDATFLVDIHVVVGSVELKHHRSTVASCQRRHCGRRSQTDEVGKRGRQRYGYLACLGYAGIGEHDRICAHLALGHGGVDAVGRHHEIRRMLACVVVGHYAERCALGCCNVERQAVPLLSFRERKRLDGVAYFGCSAARKLCVAAERNLILVVRFAGCCQTVLRQTAHVLHLDSAASHIAFVHLVLDVLGCGA